MSNKQLNLDYLMNVDMDNEVLMNLAYQDYLKDDEADSGIMGVIDSLEVA